MDQFIYACPGCLLGISVFAERQPESPCPVCRHPMTLQSVNRVGPWFVSRVGDPTNWDYEPIEKGPSQMIYTIRCRRGHCGSQYAGQSGQAAETVGLQACQRGWVEGSGGLTGWLCPFDAPKEAAKQATPETKCGYPGCRNLCMATASKTLTEHGWHDAKIGGKYSWICPACWKTIQPEPQEAARDVSKPTYEDVTDIVRSELKDFLGRAMAASLVPSDQTFIEYLLAHVEPPISEGEASDADTTGRQGSTHQPGDETRRTGPQQVTSESSPDDSVSGSDGGDQAERDYFLDF